VAAALLLLDLRDGPGGTVESFENFVDAFLRVERPWSSF
jgi:hypothetical protein